MTDERPAVRLIALGDPDAAGLCVDGVCYLPSGASGPSVGAGPSVDTVLSVPGAQGDPPPGEADQLG